MKPAHKSGAGIATAVAALVFAIAAPSDAVYAGVAKGHCLGANACKGKSDCSTGKNGCSGSNACKGQGYLELTKKACDKIPGTKFEPE